MNLRYILICSLLTAGCATQMPSPQALSLRANPDGGASRKIDKDQAVIIAKDASAVLWGNMKRFSLGSADFSQKNLEWKVIFQDNHPLNVTFYEVHVNIWGLLTEARTYMGP